MIALLTKLSNVGHCARVSHAVCAIADAPAEPDTINLEKAE